MSKNDGKLTPNQIFEKVAAALKHLCSHEQEVIEVNIAAVNHLLFRKHSLNVIRHWRDPDRIFDRSRDRPVVLEPDLHRQIDNCAKQFVRALKDLNSGTIRVYSDGAWSYGGSSRLGSLAPDVLLERTVEQSGTDREPPLPKPAQRTLENTFELSAAIRGILTAASKPAPPLRERSDLLRRVIDAAAEASPAELDKSVEQLIPALVAEDPYNGGLAAMSIGVLIESGANGAHASSALREALAKAMQAATNFARTWKLGSPPATTHEFIEDCTAVINNELGVHGEVLQAWAARDPINARVWSRMEDWFLPIMALARFSQESRDEILLDGRLRSGCAALAAVDPAMFLPFAGAANSKTGCHLKTLMMTGALPVFSDEVE